MKYLLIPLLSFMLLFSCFQREIRAQTNLPDSLIFQGSQFDIGQTFRTGLATSFGHYTVNAYFKEVSGIEHLAYVDNYKLFYFKSTDNGLSWSKEQITTGHEGDIHNCALTVDTAGKVFIGLTVHDLYNYANPTGITSGSHYFYYDAYCVNNKTGTWVTELVGLHPGNYGPKVTGLFVDASNNVHFIANYYGWYSYGGTAWEWIRSSATDTWGSRSTIVTFSDAGVDKLFYDTYAIVPDIHGNVTVVICRLLGTSVTRLFYVRYNGSAWSSPVTVADTIAVAWNRFDAVADPSGSTYIAYMKNNAQGLPELKVMKDFQPEQTASISLAPTDTLYYFRLHCNSEGLFTMYLSIKNQNNRISFSSDCLTWSDPIPAPDNIKNYIGGLIVRTDARGGYFTEYCKQIVGITGPRAAMPYGPDTLWHASIRILGIPSFPDLLTPMNGASIDTSSATFHWTNAFPEVTGYWFEIDTTTEFNTSFVDSMITDTNYFYDQLVPYQTYYWRVKAKNQRCWGEFDGWNYFNTAFVSVGDQKELPAQYKLDQNYPNPFNPSTTISYQLPMQSHVALKIFDVLGREIATLVNGVEKPGYKTVNFTANGLASGIYYYRLTAGNYVQMKKLILLR